MLLVRFLYNDSDIRYGILEAETILTLKESFNVELDIDNYHKFIHTNIDASKVTFLPPCEPTKIVGIALNYQGVSGASVKVEEPLAFIKSTNTLAVNHTNIYINSAFPTWGECELAVVIKRQAKNVNYGDTSDYILGYLPANDITSENYNGRDHHLARSKSADGFCPVGRYIDLDYKYRNKTIKGFQNNILIREGNTNDMIFSVEKIIEWLTSWMTLYPGDIILTGAPPRVRGKQFLESGDSYSVNVEGFESLSIRVES